MRGSSVQSPAVLERKLNNSDGAAIVGTSRGSVQDEVDRSFSNSVTQNEQDLWPVLSKESVKVVVTGDSISYNRYSFDESPRATAKSGLFGYKSWSYLLRDAIVSNSLGYVRAIDCPILNDETVATLKVGELGFQTYYAPMEGRGISARFTSAGQSYKFLYRTNVRPGLSGVSNDIYLHYMTDPTSGGGFNVTCRNAVTGATLDSSFLLSNSAADTSRYQGYEAKSTKVLSAASIPEMMEIEIESNDSGTTWFYLLGVHQSGPVIENTGIGGIQSSYLLSNINSMILDESPDIVVLSIGANDAYAGVTNSDFENNLNSIISAVRNANAYTRIIFVTPPLSTDYTDSVCLAYRDSIKKVALNSRCEVLDVVPILERLDPAEWRHDSIHYNQFGNELIFRSFVKKYAPSLNIDGVNRFNWSSNSYKGAKWRKSIRAEWLDHVQPFIRVDYDVSGDSFAVSNTYGDNVHIPKFEVGFTPEINVEMIDGATKLMRLHFPFYPKSLGWHYEPKATANFGGAVNDWTFRIYAVNESAGYFDYVMFKDGVMITDLSNLADFSMLLGVVW